METEEPICKIILTKQLIHNCGTKVKKEKANTSLQTKHITAWKVIKCGDKKHIFYFILFMCLQSIRRTHVLFREAGRLCTKPWDKKRWTRAGLLGHSRTFRQRGGAEKLFARLKDQTMNDYSEMIAILQHARNSNLEMIYRGRNACQQSHFRLSRLLI